MANQMYKRDFTMSGSGAHNFDIPTGPDGGYKYFAIMNSATDNEIEFYQDTRSFDSANRLEALVLIRPYQTQTTLFQENGGRSFTLVYRDGGQVMEKKVTVIFAVENPNLNFQGNDGSGSSNSTIIGDQVGLVRRSQLPTNLVNGRLGVDSSGSTMKIGAGEQVGIDPTKNTVKLDSTTSSVTANISPDNNTVKLVSGTSVTSKIDPTSNTVRLAPNSTVELATDTTVNVSLASQTPYQYDSLTHQSISSSWTEIYTTVSDIDVFEITLQNSYSSANVLHLFVGSLPIPTNSFGSIELAPGDSITLRFMGGQRIYAKTLTGEAFLNTTIGWVRS